MSSLFKLRVSQVGLLIIFVGLGLSASLTAPFSTGPDEVAHFQFVRFVARYNRLPISWEERAEAGYKSDLPPLFHLMAGTIGSGIDLDSPPYVKIAQNNPRLQLVVGHRNIKSWRALTTEDPLRGEVLIWYLGRWVTLLCGTVGVIAVYLLGCTLYPHSPWLALAAAALLAFNATYLFISRVISYEPLVGTLLAFYFLLLYYTLQHPHQNWLYLVLGGLMGLAGLTRYTVFPAIPVLPLLVLWLGYRKQWGWRTTVWRLTLVLVGLAITLGSWILYMSIYFNQITKLGWFGDVLNLFLISDNSDDTSLRLASSMTGGTLGGSNTLSSDGTFGQWMWHTFKGFWARDWLGLVVWGLWFVAMVGLVRHWRRYTEPMRLWLILLVIYIGLFWLLPFFRFLMSHQVSTGMGQHVLFPTAAAMMLLLVIGLNHWFSPKRLTQILLALAAILFVQNVLVTAQRSNSTLPIQTVPLTDHEEILASFGNISLIGYDYVADEQTLAITLHWRDEQLLDQDYRMEITLLDEEGRPQTRWLGQPVNGVYPTRAWSPGDRVRDQIRFPLLGLLPGAYEIQLRVLGEAGALAPVGTTGIVAGRNDALSLGTVTLRPSPVLPASSILLDGQEIDYLLWPQNVSVTNKLPVYGERSTIIISTRESMDHEVRLSLLGPDEEPRGPVDRAGNAFIFQVEPQFVRGEYWLRFEQWRQGEMTAKTETPPLLIVQAEERQFNAPPISHPVKADFAGQMILLGYDLPQRRVQSGEPLPITLHWQAQKTMGVGLIVFSHLINENQETWRTADRVPRDIYSTMLWVPGEIVTDPYPIQIDPQTPDGIYNLLVGLYLPMGKAAISLPLVQDGQFSDVTSVRIGPIKVGKTPAGLTVDQANPQMPLNYSLGDAPNLTLLGYDLTPQTGAAKPDLKLTLYWQVESPLSVDYTTFIHLRNRAGEIIAQQDQPPLRGAYPTSLWETGEIIADEISLPLPDPLPQDGYEVVVGLYDFYTGQRLTVPGNPANEVKLIDVEPH
ncbi:MAG: hypothetical protein JXM69_09010 [Anaerolineae bacterium]|nr:hypothetical protein [Anaerolineae bacterium]